MNFEYYDKLINKKTKGRYDITPIFRNQKAFSNLINDLSKFFKKEEFDVIVSLDSLGFIIGGAMSHKLRKSFVPVRKGGKVIGVATLVAEKTPKTKILFEKYNCKAIKLSVKM